MLIMSLCINILLLIIVFSNKNIIISNEKDMINNKILETNKFLSHINFIIRHDLYSSINLISQFYRKVNKNISKNDLESLKIYGAFNLLGQCISRLNDIYSGIYDFSLMVDESKKLPKEKFNLSLELKSHLRKTVFYSYVNIDKDIGIVNGNKSLLIIAIMNLIKNGITHNKSNNKKVYLNKINNNLIISDNGRGMTKKDFLTYIEPHVQGKNKSKGTGLGLAISKLVFTHHTLDMEIISSNKGTSIVIHDIFNIY